MRSRSPWIRIPYTAWVILIFLLPALPAIPVYLLSVPLPDRMRIHWIYAYHRLWVRCWELLTGIRFEVQDRHWFDPRQPAVLAVNHCNLLDVLAVAARIPAPWKALAKREIRQVPLIGWFIAWVTIMVDRSSPESRRRSLDRMVSTMNEGFSIVIFPEGTRNRTAQPLGPFHTGAFRLAIAAQRPVQPVVMTQIRGLQPVGTLDFYPGTARFTYLEPIPTRGLTQQDTQMLLEQVRARMEAAIIRLDPEFQPLAAS